MHTKDKNERNDAFKGGKTFFRNVIINHDKILSNLFALRRHYYVRSFLILLRFGSVRIGWVLWREIIVIIISLFNDN